MPNCGDWDTGKKFEGDRVVCLDSGHCGRKGTVVSSQWPHHTVIVQWDSDDVARTVSSGDITQDTSDE